MFKLFLICVAVVFTKCIYFVSSQDYYCRQKHNVTFLGIYHRKIKNLLTNFVDPCIHLEVSDMYTMKSVSLIHFEGIKHLNPRKLYMEKNDDGNMAYHNDYEVLSLQFLGEGTTPADGFKQS